MEVRKSAFGKMVVVIMLIALTAFVVACSQGSTVTQTPAVTEVAAVSPAPTFTSEPTATPTATPAPSPTSTCTPTSTPTLVPTETPTSTPTPTPEAGGIEITAKALNVRSGPGTEYPVIGKLSEGTEISARQILGVYGDWVLYEWTEEDDKGNTQTTKRGWFYAGKEMAEWRGLKPNKLPQIQEDQIPPTPTPEPTPTPTPGVKEVSAPAEQVTEMSVTLKPMERVKIPGTKVEIVTWQTGAKIEMKHLDKIREFLAKLGNPKVKVILSFAPVHGEPEFLPTVRENGDQVIPESFKKFIRSLDLDPEGARVFYGMHWGIPDYMTGFISDPNALVWEQIIKLKDGTIVYLVGTNCPSGFTPDPVVLADFFFAHIYYGVHDITSPTFPIPENIISNDERDRIGVEDPWLQVTYTPPSSRVPEKRVPGAGVMGYRTLTPDEFVEWWNSRRGEDT